VHNKMQDDEEIKKIIAERMRQLSIIYLTLNGGFHVKPRNISSFYGMTQKWIGPLNHNHKI